MQKKRVSQYERQTIKLKSLTVKIQKVNGEIAI